MALTLTGGSVSQPQLRPSAAGETQPPLVSKELISDEDQLFISVKIGCLSNFESICKRVSKEILRGYDKDGHTLVHWAAKREDASFLQHLSTLLPVENLHLPSQDDVGMRPIHWASTTGSISNVSFLLSHCPPREGDHRILESKDKSGCTPLLIAAQYGHADLCAFLLKRGASINAVDDSYDGALHWAAYKGEIAVVGLLCHFRMELEDVDAYGHSPLHLSSLRGHTEVVQYLLEECEMRSSSSANTLGMGNARRHRRDSIRRYLSLADKNSRTPLDLAVQKNKHGCEVILREWEERYKVIDSSNLRCSILHSIANVYRQMFSLQNWKLWMGFPTTSGEATFSQQKTLLPFALTIFIITLGFLMQVYFIGFFRAVNTLYPVLSDWPLLNMCTLVNVFLTIICFILTWKTNPGTLGTNNEYTPSPSRSSNSTAQTLLQLTAELQSQYNSTLESYADNHHPGPSSSSSSTKPQLCHSCHIVRPLRSKHCRVLRRCVLMFDHYCPFVGNTVGLYNYRYFVGFLLFMTLSEIGFLFSYMIYMHRIVTSPSISFHLSVFVLGLTVGLFIVPSITMVIYHFFLIKKNLTTNEHQNFYRYDYLKDEDGRYRNSFDDGLFHNLYGRLCPGMRTYMSRDETEEFTGLIGENSI